MLTYIYSAHTGTGKTYYEKTEARACVRVESDTRYTVCFSTEPDVDRVNIVFDEETVACHFMSETPSSKVWRVSVDVPVTDDGRSLTYKIMIADEAICCRNGRDSWQLYSPGRQQEPKIVYTSCNGFSSLDLMHKTQKPFSAVEKKWLKRTKRNLLD